MKTGIFRPPGSERDKAIADEAADWFGRVQAGNLTELEQARFAAWKAKSPAHEAAYAELSKLWEDQDFNRALQLAALKRGDRLGYPRASSQPRRGQWLHRRASLFLKVAACLLLAIGLNDPIVRIQADYHTAKGQSLSARLEDGSIIVLNTDSAVAVSFADKQRRIRLLRGEALFEVQPDASRPFVVDSGDTETTVLGTRFLVRKDSEADRVTVLRGQVQVANPERQQQVVLLADQQVTNAALGLSEIGTVADGHDDAWTRGRLVFQEARLEQVAAELERYRPGLLLFADASLKSLRINARFDITRPESALETLEQTLPLKLTRLSPWLTIIARR